jgi:REP element-mobilizing transposase RayT
MKQKSFFKNKDFPKEFGGELLKKKRKGKRPLCSKRAIHSVMRADLKNTQVFFKNRNQIRAVIKKYANLFNIRVYGEGLARDHVHLVLKFKNREDYINFTRVVTGVLAKLLKFKWLHRPFTRVLQWGRDFKKACQYVEQNELEGLGIIPYQKRLRANIRQV